ncbi:cation:proton antiporter [Prevotella sp. Rep29]|uniref:cation:proton antiporter n=1 Tax=Prevotella sp. Rep29 TaxID=2691580 RepID=UPI001C6E4FD6|nr:cation:proton antiporter [Prevotella sp. Rep29]QYR11423.1 cation:proton antiporter [Prevotella sp. Rep29]
MFHISQYFPITDPTLIFFVVLCIILFAPIIMGKLRIPHIIGMVLAGVVLGKYGFNILERDDSFELFGKVGLYYIMFLAGLEMDLESMKKRKGKIISFGLLTFAIPFILTYFASQKLLGYQPIAAALLSCIMAANTLIAYPIVGRYGLQRNRSVMLSVGSSMLSLFLALVVLAATVGTFKTDNSALFWLIFIVKVTAFFAGLIFFIPRLTRAFLRKYSDAVMQFIFVMAILFMSAALAEAIGLEGILGAFMSGLILNRYIPHVSSLMNRIEFIGNALFIPYFLIGVGMLVNVRILFQGGNIIWIVLAIVFFGTFGKALAAYLASITFRYPLSSGHMMFGLTSAHAAGAIAMVMIGMRIETAPGEFLVNDEMLNGVIIMILFTCIISTLITERAAKQIVLHDNAMPTDEKGNDDELILLPVKYKEIADGLVNLAIMTRNRKLNRGLVAVNVVYDDENRRSNQEKGKRLLESLQQTASAADVRMQTQVRVAANIANGIKHTFKEYNASEIIMGMHIHKEISPKFWGEFAQSLYNGLRRQIMFVRLKQPLNTLRRIQVAVPSRAEFEAGFYRWVERLSRIAGNLDCRIQFHGRQETLTLIQEYIQNRHPSVRAEYTRMEHWNELPRLAANIHEDHMLVVVTARKGTVSYKSALERLPDEIEHHFSGKTIIILFPDQYGEQMDEMTFATPQHQEETSAYQAIIEWLKKKKNKLIS